MGALQESAGAQNENQSPRPLKKEPPPEVSVVPAQQGEFQWSKGSDRRLYTSQAKGKVKEVAGKLNGDSKLMHEGIDDQLKGKVQNTICCIKDTLRGK